MSLSVDPVPVLVTDDPRVDLNVSPYYLVERSAGEIIYRNYESDSFSGGTINITTNISDRRTVVSSKVHLKVKFRVTATATGIVGRGGNPEADVPYAPFVVNSFDILAQTNTSHISPRFSPFISACTNCVVNINGKQMSQPVGRYFTPLMKYTTVDENTYDFSTFPSHQDTFQEPYQYLVPTANPLPNSTSTDDTLFSAIGSGYIDSDPYSPSARLGWFQNNAKVVQTNGANPTGTVCSFEFETEEILPVSPLVWGHREVKGISGIDTLNLYLNYDQQLLNKCMIASGTITSAVLPNPFAIAAAATDRCTLTFNVEIIGSSAEFIYFSPRPNIMIPEVLRYRYDTFQHVPKNISPAIAPYTLAVKGDSGVYQFTSDAITLQGMPRRMYIFIKRQYSDVNQYNLDTYARITNINLQLGNKPGILAEAQPQVLYRMAVKNGYKGSWDNWWNTQGSVVCLDFSEDIPLGTLDAPGTLSKMNMQFTVRYDNLYFDRQRGGAANGVNYLPNNLELNTVIVYEGMIVIKNGQVIEESSIVSPLDVASQNKVRNVHFDDLIDYGGGSYSGGKFPQYLSGVKKGLTKIKELGQKAAPYIEKYGPTVVSAASKAIPILTGLLAAGYTENEIYDMMQKGGVVGKKGGKRVTKKSLKARAICQ